ncbi:pectate lyase [Yersinia sp. 2544 StPb PI]|uniref:pectate lyase family protein n=2 Tax=Yersinia TaxID=629 RepID=UPI00187D266C
MTSRINSRVIHQAARNISPVGGWAAEAGGTTGGSEATSDDIYLVFSVSELRRALSESGERPKIIQVYGLIDVSEGLPYQDQADQKQRGIVYLNANTTLIGVTENAKFIEGSIIIQDASNVIVHNIYIENPVDVDPQFEEGDGWNAEWDGLNIINSHHVWIDHVTFSDGRFTIDQYTEKDGWKFVQHDGALDIKRGSDYVTISHCRFELHDKTILIGHSDSNAEQDAGTMHVTFFNNYFTRIIQRTPRVRFGSIHLYNNLFEQDKSDPIYPYEYSYGLGYQSSILSEKNIFLVNDLTAECRVMKAFNGGDKVNDDSSTFNHSLAELNNCGFDADIGWVPPYAYDVVALSQEFTDHIRNQAGSGLPYGHLP